MTELQLSPPGQTRRRRIIMHNVSRSGWWNVKEKKTAIAKEVVLTNSAGFVTQLRLFLTRLSWLQANKIYKENK